MFDVVEAFCTSEPRNGVVEGETVLEEEAVSCIGPKEVEELVWVPLRFDPVECRWFQFLQQGLFWGLNNEICVIVIIIIVIVVVIGGGCSCGCGGGRSGAESASGSQREG